MWTAQGAHYAGISPRSRRDTARDTARDAHRHRELGTFVFIVLLPRSVETLDLSGPDATWKDGPPMSAARTAACAAVQRGDTVYVIGGCDDSGLLSSCERLRRAGWEPAPQLQAARRWASAAQVDGVLHVVGGCESIDGNGRLGSLECLHERGGLGGQKWLTGAPMEVGRAFACAAVMASRTAGAPGPPQQRPAGFLRRRRTVM